MAYENDQVAKIQDYHWCFLLVYLLGEWPGVCKTMDQVGFLYSLSLNTCAQDYVVVHFAVVFSLLYALLNKVEVGYTGLTLSVCRLWTKSCPLLSLLQYLPDPFHIYTSYQAPSKGVLCALKKFIEKFKKLKFCQICNFKVDPH